MYMSVYVYMSVYQSGNSNQEHGSYPSPDDIHEQIADRIHVHCIQSDTITVQ